MNGSRIVSANAGQMRIFSRPKERAALREVGDFIKAAAHLRTQDTGTDENLSAIRKLTDTSLHNHRGHG